MTQHTKRPWKVTQQTQIEHTDGFCTLSHAIAYPGGELQVNQRIADTITGYEEGQARIQLICAAVNAHDALVEAIREALQDWQDVGSVQPETIGRMQAALSGVKGA